jgi:hypothetical protein
LKSRLYGAQEVEKWVSEEGWKTKCLELGSGEVVRFGG